MAILLVWGSRDCCLKGGVRLALEVVSWRDIHALDVLYFHLVKSHTGTCLCYYLCIIPVCYIPFPLRYATERGIYLTELSRKLLDLKSGAKVITIDKRLQGPFNLIT